MRLVLRHSLLVLLLFSCTTVYGQSFRSHEQVGKPYGYQQYLDDLPHQGQNWSITQDKRGVIYVGNHAGVLEYDGAEWRVIRIAGFNTAFSLSVNEAGVIFVGARDEIGYLAPDSSGTLVYKSLLEHVKEEDLGFGAVWITSVTSEGVHFQTNSRLFRWNGTEMKSWQSDERLHTSFAVNDRFYIRKAGVGLLELVGDSLQLIDGGARFADRRVFTMLSREGNDILIGAQKDMDGPLEMYSYNEAGLTALPVNWHLKNDGFAYTFYNGTSLPEGHLALGTLYHGVFIIDEAGELVETLDEDRGVPQDVNASFSDFQGGLWLAHNHSGISYMASPASISEYGKSEGLIGAANSVLRHNDRLYVATDDGIFRLEGRLTPENEGEDNKQFVRVSEGEGVYWSLQSVGDELFVASETGVFSIYKNEPPEFIGFKPPDAPAVLHKSRFDENRIYVGLNNGLGILSRTKSGWVEKTISSPKRRVTTIEESADGALWVTTAVPGEVIRLVLDGAGNVLSEDKITSSDDLGASLIRMKMIAGEPAIVAIPNGIFQIEGNESGEFSIVPDERFPLNLESNDQILDIVKVAPNEFWTAFEGRVEVTRLQESGIDTASLQGDLKLPAFEDFRTIYREDNGAVWISAANFRPLIKYNPAFLENPNRDAVRSPLIRKLTVLGADSLLYGGAFSMQSALTKFQKGKILDLDLQHTDNFLRFEFALPEFNKKDRVQYRYILEGHDENWSKWTSDTKVVYRNLGAGKMSFKVQARIGGMPLQETAAMVLRIRAPWFWSWWMQLFYICFVGFSVFQFVRNQRAKKQIILLNIERELNGRLQMANEQLRTANDSLEQANQMKDEFLANASHELRTPLTAILGFTSVLKEEVPEENLEFLGLIDENGKRLLQTINSLLDLAKLRAGMFELKFEALDICKKTEDVVDLLAQLAKNQNLTLDIECPLDLIKVRLDAHCYERILYNLIGNAIKFTSNGGVKVVVERNSDQVQVHVVDTGIGIDESFIPLLFDEFKQEPSNEVRVEGSGLGLTITAKLVELMNGTISVRSTKGKGSTFTVSFIIDEVETRNGDIEGRTHREERTHTTLQ